MASEATAASGIRPRATYRVQLRAGGVDFAAVEAAVGYLAALGVSHVYLSPVLAATPGSDHGYDVVDPAIVDPALGGESGLRRLADACRAQGLGLVVDVVPNHQAAHPANPAWWRLLATGRDGPEAATFDVDWEPALPAARGRVVLPVLGAPVGEVLESGELVVREGSEGPELAYHEHRMPLPARAPADAGTEAALSAAHARPCHWRIGDAVVNYRRFFAINDLAAVRVEEPAVFDRVMGTVLALAADGVVDGLRIDHIDGLADPGGFCRRLRDAVPRAWLVAEKILAPDERMPAWPIDGGTGYDFLADVLALFVDPDSEQAMTALARELGAWPADPERAWRAAKREAATVDLAADRDRVAAALQRLSAASWATADVTFGQLRAAVTGTVVRLPVYRAYAVPGAGCDAAAARLIGDAVGGAVDAVPHVPAATWRLLAEALRGEHADVDGAEVCVRGQQLSAAVTAKGVEDTFLYRQHRLVALNEVGVEPERFGAGVDAFHTANLQRAQRQATAMLTTATHDTKRGEDTRLRIAALTELPQAWRDAVRAWRTANAGLVTATDAGPAPDPATEYLTYQTLVGVWAPKPSRAPLGELADRVADYLVKACREGGERTTWTDPHAAFEDGVVSFARALLGPGRSPTFLSELEALTARSGEIAMVASLGQVLLRCASPGVPDTYQGTEGWEDTLVDPDNRRPVDFRRAAAELAAVEDADPAQLLASRGDGRVKRWVLSRALAARGQHPGAGEGGYEPLAVRGRFADHVVAFARRPVEGAGAGALVAVAPRLPGRVMQAGAGDGPLRPPVGADWDDTTVVMPDDLTGGWRDHLGGPGSGGGPTLPLAQVLGVLPVALLAPAG